MKLIVADASPMIIIAKSRLIPILAEMVDEVIIPQTVHAECTLEMSLPGAQAIRAAVESGEIQVHPDVEPPHGSVTIESPALDSGERAAIALAQTLQCPLLIDERYGRQAAKRSGVTVIGSAGLLLEAKKRGLIPAVAPILDQWRKSGYFLSPSVVKAVLERADEV